MAPLKLIRPIHPHVALEFGNYVYTADSNSPMLDDHGIYVAFAGHRTHEGVELDGLLYIGKADKQTFKERIADHAKNEHETWLPKEHQSDCQIFYAVASLKSHIANTEAALIFDNKPPYNTQGVDNYMGTRPIPDITNDIGLKEVNGFVLEFKAYRARLKKIDPRF